MKKLFTTLAHRPRWLEHELEQARSLFPGRCLLVMFADDLPKPEPERHALFIERFENLFGTHPDDIFAENGTEKAVNHRGGCMLSNAQMRPHADTELECLRKKTIITPAMFGSIVLFPASITTQNFISLSLNIAPQYCAKIPRFNPNKIAFPHELGHFDLLKYKGTTYCDKSSERHADRFTLQHLRAQWDEDSAQTLLALRTLKSLTSPITVDNAKYWNPLSLRFSNVTDTLEIASILELKQRVVGIRTERDKAATKAFITACFHSESHTLLRSHYAAHNPSSPSLAEKLSRLNTIAKQDDFVFPYTAELAALTISATKRLLPGLNIK